MARKKQEVTPTVADAFNIIADHFTEAYEVQPDSETGEVITRNKFAYTERRVLNALAKALYWEVENTEQTIAKWSREARDAFEQIGSPHTSEEDVQRKLDFVELLNAQLAHLVVAQEKAAEIFQQRTGKEWKAPKPSRARNAAARPRQEYTTPVGDRMRQMGILDAETPQTGSNKAA